MNQPYAPASIEPAAKDNEQQEDVEAPIDEVCERCDEPYFDVDDIFFCERCDEFMCGYCMFGDKDGDEEYMTKVEICVVCVEDEAELSERLLKPPRRHARSRLRTSRRRRPSIRRAAGSPAAPYDLGTGRAGCDPGLARRPAGLHGRGGDLPTVRRG